MGVDLRKQLISPQDVASPTIAGADKTHNGWFSLWSSKCHGRTWQMRRERKCFRLG